MLRVRFLQDVILTENFETCKRNNERDFKYDLAKELYDEDLVDIINPYEHKDLSSRIGLYKKDWEKFMKEVKGDWTV